MGGSRGARRHCQGWILRREQPLTSFLLNLQSTKIKDQNEVQYQYEKPVVTGCPKKELSHLDMNVTRLYGYTHLA